MLVKQQRIKEILDEIQRKRHRMIETAKTSGLTSDETIRQSQELDRLIYEYQCLFRCCTPKKETTGVTGRQLMLLWPRKRVSLGKS